MMTHILQYECEDTYGSPSMRTHIAVYSSSDSRAYELQLCCSSVAALYEEKPLTVYSSSDSTAGSRAAGEASE